MSAPHGDLNAGEACTRLPCARGLGAKTALRWVGPDGSRVERTFAQLEERSARAANAFEALGLRAGDPLFVVLPKVPEQFEAVLGALRARLLCGVLYPNFGEKGLCDRLSDARAKALLTRTSLERRCRGALAALPALQRTIVLEEEAPEGCLSYPALASAAPSARVPAPTSPEDPSLLHYTSGSTGRPKGVVHVHGALESQRETAREVLGLRPDDVYWCSADLGWVTGTSYGLLGPWSLGVTQLHYGGAYDARVWLDLLEREKVSVFYTAPTALRMLMREDPRLFRGRDLSALRAIFSVGEPLNPEIIRWAREVLGKEVFDTWFQTETGAVMVANRPGLEVRPGSMGKPVAGVRAEVLSPMGEPCADGERGLLALRAGWPSMFRGYLGQEDAYRSKFRAGWYLSGDEALRDRDGYLWFLGRSDDVINTAGHLVSPFEIESAALELPEVAEAGAVGAPDALLHEKVVLFLRLKGAEPSRALELKVRLHVSRRVSTVATPQEVRFVAEIPKTRSGKILRRVLRASCGGAAAGPVEPGEE